MCKGPHEYTAEFMQVNASLPIAYPYTTFQKAASHVMLIRANSGQRFVRPKLGKKYRTIGKAWCRITRKCL